MEVTTPIIEEGNEVNIFMSEIGSYCFFHLNNCNFSLECYRFYTATLVWKNIDSF